MTQNGVMFDANVVKVLIASPSDTQPLRDRVEEALHAWNTDRAEAASVILLPRRWETGSVPELTGSDGQSVINAQLVDDAGIVIALFDQTLGAATPRAASGTAEELEHAHTAGKPVHVYFSNMPVARHHDRAKLADLDAFRDEVKKNGLYGSFDPLDDLEDQVRSAIEFDLRKLSIGKKTSTKPAGAILSAGFSRDREPGRNGRMVSKNERIVISNTGTAAATEVTLSFTPMEEDAPLPIVHRMPPKFDLAPEVGTFAIPIQKYGPSANVIRVDFSWMENGEPKTGSDTVSLY